MLLFLSRLFRVVLLLLIARFVLRGIARFLRASRGAVTPREPQRAPATDLIRDRVCNTFLPRDKAVRAIVAGREEHFCSAACRDKALAALSPAS